MTDIDRRTFLTGLSTASAFTIVPRRVLGGQGFVAPSDMIRLAQVGCGLQSQRQVNTGFVKRPDVQFVAVVDPNRDSQNYVDWSEFGNRNQIRRFLEDPQWGAADKGIRGGREVAREIMETYYRKQQRPGGIRAYEDYREMLEKETDIQGVINITPDHQHGSINIAALRKGKAAISHKPVASVLYEVRRTLQAARESSAVSHLLAYSNNPDRHTLAAWIRAGVIGTIREVHNWTDRPFWPQGMQEYHTSGPAVPDGFNWALWQGPEPERPYHPSYTFAVYRGWYAYGTGCLGDMGHYSLWQPYRILNLGVPEWVEGRPNNEAWVSERNVSTGGRVSTVGFPRASSVRWRHPATATSSGGRHVLVRRRDEAADAGRTVRRRRGSRCRGHAHHRRPGQDPVRLPRQCTAPAPAPAVSRRSPVPSPCPSSTRPASKTSGSTRSRPARSPEAASRKWPRSPKP